MPQSDQSSPQGGRTGRLLRRWPWTAVAVAVVLGGVIMFVAAPLNVAARTGPYPGVSWLVHTYMRNWARNWSWGVERPDYADLSDPALIRLGAGYFETGCAPCHGAPGRARNPVARLMEPAPPNLAKHIHNFSTNQLYWIVYHGIRYTGMPGWTGDHRQDEVWAMIAFLEQYDDLDAKEYEQLAYGEIEPHIRGNRMSFGGLSDRLDKVVQNCARCHGTDGMGRDGTAPIIAGQSEAYLLATLRGYASGERSSGIMQPIAAPLSDEMLQDLAAHYAEMSPSDAGAEDAGRTDQNGEHGEDYQELLDLGQRLAAAGDPSHFVPPCSVCHEESESRVPPRSIYPGIAGQERRFIAAWLHLYRERPFGGTDFANVMHYAAKGLTDHQIDALAAWYASLPWRGKPVDAKGAQRADATTDADPERGGSRMDLPGQVDGVGSLRRRAANQIAAPR